MHGFHQPDDGTICTYDYILRELAASMDLDEDLILNDAREAQLQAKMMAEMQRMMGEDLMHHNKHKVQWDRHKRERPTPDEQGFTGTGGEIMGDNLNFGRSTRTTATRIIMDRELARYLLLLVNDKNMYDRLQRLIEHKIEIYRSLLEVRRRPRAYAQNTRGFSRASKVAAFTRRILSAAEE